MPGIKGYRPSIQTTRIHKERTENNVIPFPSPKENYNSAGEAEVVPGFQIAEEIRKFQQRWEIEYPKDGLDFNSANIFLGPLQYIEEETARLGSRVPIRFLSYVLHGDKLTVGYSRAEIILMALGKEYLLKTGEIQVVPNPNWSLEKWLNYMESRGCI